MRQYGKAFGCALATEAAFLGAWGAGHSVPMDYHDIVPGFVFLVTHPTSFPIKYSWPSGPRFAVLAMAFVLNLCILTLLWRSFLASLRGPGGLFRNLLVLDEARRPFWIAVAVLLALLATNVICIKLYSDRYEAAAAELERLCDVRSTVPRLAQGKEQELATIAEVERIDDDLEVVYETSDRSVFLTVVGEAVSAYESRRYEYYTALDRQQERVEQELAELRARLVEREEHAVTVARSGCGHGGSLLVFVDGRLWYRKELELEGLAEEKIGQLKSREGRPLELRVGFSYPPETRMTGGRDLGVLAGRRYEVLRGGKRIAVVEVLCVSARFSTVKVIESTQSLRGGDAVRVMPEEAPETRKPSPEATGP